MSSPAVGEPAKTKLSNIRFNHGERFMLSFKHITIQVGPKDDCRAFDIDTRPLTAHSEFFATMLSGPWRETQNNTVALTDDDPDVFYIFALFIHHGKIFSTRADDVEVYPDGSRRDREWARLARDWVLGDKLQATAFKDAVADAICDKMALDRKWPITLHQIIYAASTAMARRIRRLCVDIAVTKWDARTLQSTLRDDAWAEFFEEVAMRLMVMRARKSEGLKESEIDFERPACLYHEHVAEGKACWKTMDFLDTTSVTQ